MARITWRREYERNKHRKAHLSQILRLSFSCFKAIIMWWHLMSVCATIIQTTGSLSPLRRSFFIRSVVHFAWNEKRAGDDGKGEGTFPLPVVPHAPSFIYLFIYLFIFFFFPSPSAYLPVVFRSLPQVCILLRFMRACVCFQI